MVKMIDNYILSEVIGQGSFGKVYRSTHINKPTQYAIKAIPNQKLNQNKKLYEFIHNQVNVLSNLQESQHIVKYYQMIRTKNNLYFVYEYCNGGTLMDKIKNQKTIDEKQALGIFQDILSAFKILNKYQIMHRDIKPENILFHNGKVKLGDFGFCKDLKKQDSNMTKTMLGSPIYMAPQVLKGQNYTTIADIWSLGVIFYQMLYGFCPFQSHSIAKLISKINQTQFNFPQYPKVSFQTKNLIKRLLTKDPLKRIKWTQLFDMKCSQCSTTHESFPPQKLQDSHQSFISSYNFVNTFNSSIGTKNLTNTNFKNSENSVFNSFQDNKKPCSLGKYSRAHDKPQDKDKINIFYSQNYKDVLSRAKKDPLNLQSKSDIKIEQEKQKYEPKEYLFLMEKQPEKDVAKIKIEKQPYLTFLSNHNKRQRLINLHQQCTNGLIKGLQLLERKQKLSIQICYLTLKKVHQKLKIITSQIKMTDIDLLDISSLISFELIQIDRQIVQLKQQILTLKRQIPQNLSYEMKNKIGPTLISLLQQ